MKRTLAEVDADLAACDQKMESGHTHDLRAEENRLLAERTKLLLEQLKPLRSVVLTLMGKDLKMADTKKWTEAFEDLAPSAQSQMYEDAVKEVGVLAHLLGVAESTQEGQS